MFNAPFCDLTIYSTKLFCALSIADHWGFCKRSFNIFSLFFGHAVYLIDKVFGNGGGVVTQMVEDGELDTGGQEVPETHFQDRQQRENYDLYVSFPSSLLRKIALVKKFYFLTDLFYWNRPNLVIYYYYIQYHIQGRCLKLWKLILCLKMLQD